MFSPITIIAYYDRFERIDFCFLLCCTILYDVYMYSIIQKSNNFEGDKEQYYKFVKNSNKKLNAKISYEEKFKLLEEWIEGFLDKYSK